MGQSADFLACIKALAPKGGNSITTVIFIACISHLKMHILLNVFDEAVKMDFVKSPLLKVLTLRVHVLNILCGKMESTPEVS